MLTTRMNFYELREFLCREFNNVKFDFVISDIRISEFDSSIEVRWTGNLNAELVRRQILKKNRALVHKNHENPKNSLLLTKIESNSSRLNKKSYHTNEIIQAISAPGVKSIEITKYNIA